MTPSSNNTITRWLQPVANAWRAMPAPRRKLWGTSLAVLMVLVVWQAWVWPTYQRWRALPPQITALQTQWQRMSATAQALKAAQSDANAPAATPPTPEALGPLLQQRWGSQARWEWKGSALVITLQGVSGVALAQGMQTLQAAGLRATQAQLQNAPEKGWSGQMEWRP